MKLRTACLLAAACTASVAVGQPTITSLGSGAPFGVSGFGVNNYYVSSGNARWTLAGNSLGMQSIPGAMGGGGLMSANGNIVVVTVENDSPQVSSNVADGVSPPFSTTPTLTPVPIDVTEQSPAIWDATTGTLTRLGGLPVVPELMVYGSGSSGDPFGTFVSPLGISANGRFVVGMGYISTYSDSSGENIGNMTWQWRPFVWDSQANGGAGAYTLLPTPARTSFATWRLRTGIATCVSNDGKVIVGGQEHNVGSFPDSADPDAARPAVWRWNEGTGGYDMTYLPMGVDQATGYPWGISFTGSSFLMNSTGTIIVGPAADNDGNGFTAKWVWNSGTSSWNAPIAIVPQMEVEASWLPGAVTSCGIPPSFDMGAMTEDGNTVVGQATYSTCGSFMSGGFIWHASDNVTMDWYDYLVSIGTMGVTENYGPVGDNGDPTRGLPRLGFPTGMTADGSAVVGFLGGATRIPGAPSSIVKMNGGSTCVPPSVTQDPANVTFSRCSTGETLNAIFMGAWASGTLPMTFQWYKNGVALTDGPTPTGSTVSGATDFLLMVTTLSPADAGSYHCVITGCNGATVVTAAAAAQADPAMAPPANDVCETATEVGEGTHLFNMCGAYQTSGFPACSPVSDESGDIWYRYVPTFTGNARFHTCGTFYDTAIQLTTGCSGSVLACNDDVGSRGLVGVFCGSNQSVISSYPVVEGEAIYVRVSSVTAYTSETGMLTIEEAPAPPANDLCGSATPVGLGTFEFDLTDATEDYTFGTDFCANPEEFTQATNRDVWFRLTSPCGLGGTYTITTCGSDIFNPALHAMSSCIGGSILACNDDSPSGTCDPDTFGQARIDLTVTGDVLIRVSASGEFAPYGSGHGQIVITGTDNCGPVCGTSDYNGDGDFGTDADIESFFACLAGSCCPTCFSGGSDFNADGDFGTDADIESFFRVLAGGPC